MGHTGFATGSGCPELQPGITDALVTLSALGASRPLNALWADQTSLAGESLGTSRTCGPYRTLSPLRTRLAPQTLGSLQAHGPLRPLRPFGPSRALRADVTLLTGLSDWALGAYWTLRTFGSRRTGVALLSGVSDGSLRTDRPLGSSVSTRSTRIARDTLRSLWTFRSNRSLWALGSHLPLGPFRSLWPTRVATRPCRPPCSLYALRSASPRSPCGTLRPLWAFRPLRAYGSLGATRASGPVLPGRTRGSLLTLRASGATRPLLALQAFGARTCCKHEDACDQENRKHHWASNEAHPSISYPKRLCRFKHRSQSYISRQKSRKIPMS